MWLSVSDSNVRFGGHQKCRKFLAEKAIYSMPTIGIQFFVISLWSVCWAEMVDIFKSIERWCNGASNPLSIPHPHQTLENCNQRNNSTNVYQYLLAWYAHAHLVLYTYTLSFTHKTHFISVYRMQLNLFCPKIAVVFNMNVHSIIIYFPIHHNTNLKQNASFAHSVILADSHSFCH